jgi:hypothetical protein
MPLSPPAGASLEVVGRRVSRLVQTNLARARHPEPDQAPEAPVLDVGGEFDPFGREFGHGAFHVVTHQVQLMMTARSSAGRLPRVSGVMDAELGRGKLEDEPTPWAST